MTAPSHSRGVSGMEKVTIYHAATGVAIQRRPVDAAGMVNCGEYRYTPLTDDSNGEEVTKTTPSAQGPDGTHAVHAHEAIGGAHDDDAQNADGEVAPVRRDEIVLADGRKTTPLGEPIRSVHSRDASPAQPYQHPQGYTKAGLQDKRFRRP